jgi:hypothetical protein
MRLHVGLLTLLVSISALAGAAPSSLMIDLDAPHRMEVLARENPTHYKKVSQMMAEARLQPVRQIPSWMKATFNADDVDAPLMVRTSNPGQRLLIFTLEGTRYSKLVFIASTAKAKPAE